MDAKLKDRLLKLLALTESSNEHESASAMRRIEALCAKHGVNMDDLVDPSEEVRMHWFRYDNPYSKSVLLNTIWRATNINQTFKSGGRQRQVGVKCTTSQASEIDLWWSVMRASLKQHLEDSTLAFIYANKLFGESEKESDYELTDEEVEAAERASNLAARIKPTAVYKALESK